MTTWKAVSAIMALAYLIAFSQPRHVSADQDTAVAAFHRAVELYKRGDYEQALTLFQAAYREDPAPVLLYNVAECQQRLNRPDLAIRAFKEYLRTNPDAEDRAEVEKRIRALRAQWETPSVVAPEANRAEAQADSQEKKHSSSNDTKREATGPSSTTASLAIPDGSESAVTGQPRIASIDQSPATLLSTLPKSSTNAAATEGDALQPSDSAWRNPWLWTGVGAAVVGAVLVGVVLTTNSSSDSVAAIPGDVGGVIAAISVNR